ncbi:MAG: aspartyl/asparaginyl beta-hydroxylase domain-containing protein [Pseudomonadota bacterium]
MERKSADDVTALVRGAEEALRSRDARTALELLGQAAAAAPGDLAILMLAASAHRLAGDATSALGLIERVLAVDPYHFVALLSKGALLETLAGRRIAARFYRDILEAAPPPDRTPPALAAPIAHARRLVEENSEALAAYMRDRLAEIRARHGATSLDRFDEALDIYAGRCKPYVQQPLLLHIPRLPAIPFYDRADFPWLPRLEAATDMIRAELLGALDKARDEFAPYVSYPPGAPVGQWNELNNSMNWRSLWLWKDGARQEEACAVCPGTAALLAELPMADQPGYAPTALFSALEARTRIPPHTGSTNARLLVHLPLVLPGPARFRVGNVTRDWRMGEAWVFDDSIDHEAWNDADELRVILIFDIWNPFLSEAERELITATMNARNDYYAAGASPM